MAASTPGQDDLKPVASYHLAEERFPERASGATVDHDAAWARGHQLDVPSSTAAGYRPVPPHDEARVDPETRTVLFRRGETLVTCYDIDRVDHQHGHAVRAAVATTYPHLIDDE
jgi:hypothetical protein